MTHTSTQRLFNETALNKMPQGVIFQALARRTISWYPTKADLLAETGGYAGDENTPAAGEWVTNDWVATRDGYVYQVAASSASDHDEITAGSVKLYEKSLSAALLDARLTAAEGDISTLEADVAALGGQTVYDDFADMFANLPTGLAAGTLITTRREGFVYEIVSSGEDLTVTSGATVAVVPDADGYTHVGAWGFKGDGSAGDLARLQAASDATPYLRFSPGVYLIDEFLTTPTPWWTRHRRVCVFLTNEAHWRGSNTILRITSGAQDEAELDDARNDIGLVVGVGEVIRAAGNTANWSSRGITYDEGADAQGFGCALSHYGYDKVDISETEIHNAQGWRIGADREQYTKDVVGGETTFVNGCGTFSFGSKPRGVVNFRIGKLYFKNTRGMANFEAEELDEAGIDDSGLTDESRSCVVEALIAQDGDGQRVTGTASPWSGAKVADKMENVQIGMIEVHTAVSTDGSGATAFHHNPGQTDFAVKRLQVGQIKGTLLDQCINIEVSGASNPEFLQFGQVISDRVRNLLRVIRTTTSTGVAQSIIIDKLSGNSRTAANGTVGEVIYVNTDTASDNRNARAPMVKNLQINGGDVVTGKRVFHIRGAERIEVNNLTCLEHAATNANGGFPQDYYNYIDADEIVLRGVTLRGFGSAQHVFLLRPRKLLRIMDCDFFGGGVGGSSDRVCVMIDGSGDIEVSGGSLGGSQHAFGFLEDTYTFDAATGVNTSNEQITITAHGFYHGEQVAYTEGSSPIGGLTTGTNYWVNYVDANTITLSATLRGSAINLTSVGAGTATLRKQKSFHARDFYSTCPSIAVDISNCSDYTAPAGVWS